MQYRRRSSKNESLVYAIMRTFELTDIEKKLAKESRFQSYINEDERLKTIFRDDRDRGFLVRKKVIADNSGQKMNSATFKKQLILCESIGLIIILDDARVIKAIMPHMHPDVDQFVNGKPIMVLTQKGKKFLEAIQYCKFTKFGDVLASVAGTETNEEIIDLLMKLSEKMRNRENPFYNVTSPSDL